MKRSIVEKQRQITELTLAIAKIQTKCSHPQTSLEKRYDGNISYDYEHYWADFHCLECDKRWRADSHDVEYHRKADIIIPNND